MNKSPRRKTLSQRLVEFRHSLSYIDALPQLTLLGLVVGLLTGAIIVIFRLAVEIPLHFLLPDNPEHFESLSTSSRCIFIMVGILLLILLLQFIKAKYREGSVSHVIDRVHNHQAKLPFKNWCVQFIGAVIALASGQSVGREGPVVHLGAGAASLFGQWLKLPNNSIQTLVGCGVAAAISASFNTPMAGVIFAMEVLAIEYTIVGFVPVILASVMGTMISKAAFGDAGFIVVGDVNINSLYEIPVMAVVGIVISLCAGLYIRLNIFTLRFNKRSIALRLAIAGVFAMAISAALPQVMGQGYDTVNAAIGGEILLTSLIAVGLAKLVVTPVIVGLGVPGGLIGPLLVIGACVGGAVGLCLQLVFPSLGIDPAFYILMGMAGMMAASLNAPLAALVTVLELSYNPNIIFPSMLVIVVACVSTRQLFKVKGIFIEQLGHSKRSLDFGPAKQALRRAGVRSVMNTRFVISRHDTDLEKAKALLLNHPSWLVVIDKNQRYSHAMRAADLANHIEDLEHELKDKGKDKDLGKNKDPEKDKQDSLNLDLLEIPSRSYRLAAIHETASLYEAMQGFSAEGTEMLYVSGTRTAYSGDLKGIISLSSIENYYKPVEFRHAVD